MTRKPHVQAAILIAMALAMSPKAALSQEVDASVVIADVSCRDLLLQTGAEQERTISFLHGYAAGAADVAEVNVDELVTATTRLLEACIEAPDEGALAMLQEVLS